jgi:phosphatidylserine/phosphatidylglycerophosphate/cardiolipin synthase-like enzyme
MAQLRKDAAREFRKQLTLGHPTDADEAGLRRLATQLCEKRVRVKLFVKHPLHAKLYLAHRDDAFHPIIACLGSSNLTLSGLKSQGELNIDVPDPDTAEKLHRWFEDRWDDSRCLDISVELVEIINESWVPPASSSSPHAPTGQDARAPLNATQQFRQAFFGDLAHGRNVGGEEGNPVFL